MCLTTKPFQLIEIIFAVASEFILLATVVAVVVVVHHPLTNFLLMATLNRLNNLLMTLFLFGFHK